MYILNQTQKELEKIPQTSFSENNLKERYDLQEWIDKSPQILGEDLLIIQKEFSGFDKTKERLDLLAIDKSGNLVLIENKLDDSGKDVVWQAIKYASYVANLSKNKIINIYQEYLNKKEQGTDATDEISRFLDKDFEQIDLNIGYRQRVILVSKEFQPEVTSTVLWLRGNGIDIQCIKVIPYRLGDKILVDVDKIIPLPETGEYLIGLRDKEIEERKISKNRLENENLQSEYWVELLAYCKSKNFQLFKNRNFSSSSWIGTSSGVISNLRYNFILLKNSIRVELYINDQDKETNKKLFDALYAFHTEINSNFGTPLNWERLDDRKASRVSFGTQFDRDNKDEWDIAIRWHYENMKKFEESLRPFIQKISSEYI
ncbi:hypothetical protein A6B39_01185 [Mannheimia granulomatis]|uniref:DUF4268 domain-containing protein n=1 Tax=Mannheimia granulomatis TaxID=85402 RepID=UPI00159D516D|nr:DUF4268 domain-containing protein [Mannheimia granulomatis]QLB14159.1 hypothetical protein A6B39_01185 [Mannheimia granulomatis]